MVSVLTFFQDAFEESVGLGLIYYKFQDECPWLGGGDAELAGCRTQTEGETGRGSSVVAKWALWVS